MGEDYSLKWLYTQKVQMQLQLLKMWEKNGKTYSKIISNHIGSIGIAILKLLYMCCGLK